MTYATSSSLLDSLSERLTGTGSGSISDLFSSRLLALGFSQLGRVGLGGIMALNMAALPAMGTSPLILDNRPFPKCVTATSKPSLVSLRPTTEQLQVISQVLSLSRTDLARVMRISRPPLYDWLKGKNAPKDENARRLNTIARLVDEVARADNRPIFSLFVTEPLEAGVPSIFECLQQEVLDQELLGKLLAKAREHTSQRDQRLLDFERDTPRPESLPETRDARLDLNLTVAEWDQA